MGRRKKQEVDGGIASHDEAVIAFTERCFKNGEPMCIVPTFGEIYTINGVNYQFTEQVLEDIIATERVIVTFQNDKNVNLRGVRT